MLTLKCGSGKQKKILLSCPASKKLGMYLWLLLGLFEYQGCGL